MKALIAYKPGELRIVEVEKPEPGPNEVLVKVAQCGICATDIAIMNGTLNLGKGKEPIYPVRLGHEWSGTVVATGSATRRLHIGDRVISDTSYSCGECKYCLLGEYQSCVNGRAIGTIGNCWPGAFAEYMLMPERLTFNVPDNISLEEAALVEPASIGLYGLTRVPIRPGKNLLVIGTGPIGLGGMSCAKGMGIGKTILAGRKDKKLEIGKKMGADIIVNTTKGNLFDIVMSETNGRGMDIIMDTSGSWEIINDVLTMLGPSGALVIPAFYEQDLRKFQIDKLIINNCTLIGVAGTPNMGRVILDMLSYGHVSLKPMITDRFKFDNIKQGFEVFTEKNESRVKIMIDF